MTTTVIPSEARNLLSSFRHPRLDRGSSVFVVRLLSVILDILNRGSSVFILAFVLLPLPNVGEGWGEGEQAKDTGFIYTLDPRLRMSGTSLRE